MVPAKVLPLPDAQDESNDGVIYGIKKLPRILPKTGFLSPLMRIFANKKVETEIPSWTKAHEYTDASSAPRDVTYWQNALPYVQDRHADHIVVIPSQGIVTPIIDVPETDKDFSKMINGGEIGLTKYLSRGVLQYPGTADTTFGTGEAGNMVLFGHSSDWKKNPGNYKTIFGALPSVKAGEEVWVYTAAQKEEVKGKVKSGIPTTTAAQREEVKGTENTKEYILTRYKVSDSYETVPSDVNVLKPVENIDHALTLFTCTPIGTAQKRWIVRAERLADTSTSKNDAVMSLNAAPSV
jgi:sortase (surface protein transpeptidase)